MRNRFFVSRWVNEWRQIFHLKRCNWYELTFCHVYFEIDDMAQAYEFEVIVLGLGVTIRYDRDFAHSTTKRILDEDMNEIESMCEDV